MEKRSATGRLIIASEKQRPPQSDVWRPKSLEEVLAVQEALKSRQPHLRQIVHLPPNLRLT